ncbi:hypothetical protein H0E86_03970 [Streptomyces sp. SCSIO-PteL053]|nr:hypothetical protein H0E86_03970 [Streptomyces sp. SCSIO-PteL053]
MVTQQDADFDGISFTFTNCGALRRAVDAATSKARREGKTSWADTLVFDAWLSLRTTSSAATKDLCTAYFLKLNEDAAPTNTTRSAPAAPTWSPTTCRSSTKP